METVVKTSNRRMPREKILVDIPQSDWKEYMKNAPKNVDLSEEEIMEEVRAVRYGKAQSNY